MAWTTVEDIKDRWIGSKMLPLDNKLAIFIKDIEDQIIRRYPAINDRILSNDITVETIVFNVSRILTEFLLTEGTPFQQETQSYSGIGSRSVSVSSSARKSLLLTEEDLAAFAPQNVNATMISVTMNAGIDPYRTYPYLGWVDDLYA